MGAVTHLDGTPAPGRTVLLDLDGTLVDSAALITEHLAAALAATGAPALTPAELRSCVGPPIDQALPTFGLTREQTVAVYTRYRHTYDQVAAARTPLFPGVEDLLRRLDAAGLRLAVATSKPEHTARAITAALGIDRYFALVGGADQGAGRVGKAAVIASVLARLPLDPGAEPVLMVGDRHHDVDGATAHGIATIGVSWGYAPDPGELHAARRVVSTLDELAALLVGDAVWPPARTSAAPARLGAEWDAAR